jgi:hypothetical protein
LCGFKQDFTTFKKVQAICMKRQAFLLKVKLNLAHTICIYSNKFLPIRITSNKKIITMKKILSLLLITALNGFFINTTRAQVATVDCNNLSLQNSIFTISPANNTITTEITSTDSVSAVYPQYEILLEDASIITPANAAFGSILSAGFPEDLVFEMTFQSTSFANFIEVEGFVHVLDSDSPGDTTANCYLPITIILEGSTSIDESFIQNHSYKVFPNPSNAIANIAFSNPNYKNCSLVLFNSYGEVVRKTEGIRTEKIILHRENLAPGIYYFHISNDAEVLVSGKLIFE